ncbi:MAG: hypothetical protein GXP38_16495 [Chloroflexi bacterium]|nr:hypothetical protein [Chloroflexota bacterium]
MLLQEIITIIRRWFWLLVLGALVGALLSYGSALRSTAIYETTAGVVVVQQGVKINLDPRFVATTGEGGLFNVQGDGLSTLALLVTNDAIAEQVYADLNGDLSQLVQQGTQLTGMVSGDIQKGMIQIKARSSNPQLSQKLANAWAVHYADYVNRIYAGKLVATGLTEQIQNAKTRYEEAEVALAAFIRTDESQKLKSIITDRQAILDRMLFLRQEELAGKLETLMRPQNPNGGVAEQRSDFARTAKGW